MYSKDTTPKEIHLKNLLTENSKDGDSKSSTSAPAHQNDDKRNLSALESDEAAEAKAKARVMTSTTVNGYSKFAGLYCQILKVLPHVSKFVVHGLFHLVDYYMHAVINIYLPGEILEDILRGTPPNDDMNSPCWRYKHLRQTAIRIDAKLNAGSIPGSNFNKSTESSRFVRSSSLDTEMTNEESLYGLEKSCIATESLLFLNEINEFLLGYLESETYSMKRQKIFSRSVNRKAMLLLKTFGP